MYQYSPIKIIHSDFDLKAINKISKTEIPLITIGYSGDWKPYEMTDKPPECKIVLEKRFRFYKDKTKKEQIGSYISEQFFYVTYISDELTRRDLKTIFEDAEYFSKQKFDEIKINQNLPINQIGHFGYPDSWIEEALLTLHNVFHKHKGGDL